MSGTGRYPFCSGGRAGHRSFGLVGWVSGNPSFLTINMRCLASRLSHCLSRLQYPFVFVLCAWENMCDTDPQARAMTLTPVTDDELRSAHLRSQQPHGRNRARPDGHTAADPAAVKQRKAGSQSKIKATATRSGKQTVNVDGELIGFSPLRIEVLASVLRVLC